LPAGQTDSWDERGAEAAALQALSRLPGSRRFRVRLECGAFTAAFEQQATPVI